MPSYRAIAEWIATQGPGGFGPVVRSTQHRLYRVALRILADAADAEDAVQEAYLRAFDAICGGRYDERTRIEAWLVTIVSRVAIDALRSRKVRALESESLPPGPPEMGEDQLCALVELEQRLSDLSPEQRVLVVLKFMEGLTSAEVGDVLGISEGAVEQRLLRARATLKRRASYEPA